MLTSCRTKQRSPPLGGLQLVPSVTDMTTTIIKSNRQSTPVEYQSSVCHTRDDISSRHKINCAENSMRLLKIGKEYSETMFRRKTRMNDDTTTRTRIRPEVMKVMSRYPNNPSSSMMNMQELCGQNVEKTTRFNVITRTTNQFNMGQYSRLIWLCYVIMTIYWLCVAAASTNNNQHSLRLNATTHRLMLLANNRPTNNNNNKTSIQPLIMNITSVHYESPALTTTPATSTSSLGKATTSTTTEQVSSPTTSSSLDHESSDMDSEATTITSASVASTTIGNEQPVTKTSAPGEPDEEATSDEEASSSDQDNETETNSRRLTNTLSDTASDAIDKLVVRLKPAEVEAPSDEESTSENEDETSTNNNSTISEQQANKVPNTRSTRDHLMAATMADKLIVKSPPPVNFTELRASELNYALDTYGIWRSSGEELIELISRKLLPLVMEHGYEVDPVTVTGLLQVFNGLRGLKPWAMKLLDASTKLSPGILLGTQSDFGDYDECLNVRVDDPAGLGLASQAQELDPTTGLPQSTIVGRYCLADVEFPKPPRELLANGSRLGPIELLRPLYDFAQSANFRDTIWVETANFFHMLYVDPIRSAICLTNKIDPDSFAEVFNKVFAEFRVTIKFNGRCLTKYDKREWSHFQQVSAWIVSVACLLVMLSTLLELLALKLDKLPVIGAKEKWRLPLSKFFERHWLVLSSFSLLRNTKRIFKRPQAHLQAATLLVPASYKKQNLSQEQDNIFKSKQPDSSVSQILEAQASSSLESSPQIDRRSSAAGSSCQLLGSYNDKAPTTTSKSNAITAAATSASLPLDLNCLHGIRVITMAWMIVNHTYMFGGFFVLWAHRRLIDIAEWPKSLSFQLVLNGWLTVETYFFLSAMIIILNVMPLMRASKFSYAHFILHRLIRLVPAYGGLVALNFLWPLVSSGPVWLVKGHSFIESPCENYLWTNFLFINNWIWPEKQCMVHTWFLSADFQLYLLAPLIVYLLYKRPVLGHSLNVIIALCASILSGFVIFANNLLPATLINKLEFDSIKQQLSYSYFATYQHMGPYCLGLFVGYVLHKRPNIRLPTHLSWALWLLLPPLSFTTLLLTYLWNGAYSEPSMINPSPLVSAFYIAIHRIIWTSLTAWLVFACVTNRAKMLASFLSHYYFVPISRLSFSIYLVHMPLIMYRALNVRHTKEWTDGNILWEACGNFVTSCLLGYFLNVTFESPLINLEQALFGHQRSATSERLGVKVASQRSLDMDKQAKLQQQPQTDSSSTGNSSTTGDDDVKTSSDSSTSNQFTPHQVTTKKAIPKIHKAVQSERIATPGEEEEEPDFDATTTDEIYQLESENYHNGRQNMNLNRTQSRRVLEDIPRSFNERPAHYATLARTSRFSKQDMSSLLSHRQARQVSATQQRPAAAAVSTTSERGSISRNNRYPSHERPSSFRPNITQSSDMTNMGFDMDLATRRNHMLLNQQQPQRRARYNTLTGARDWVEQSAYDFDSWRSSIVNDELDEPPMPSEMPPAVKMMTPGETMTTRALWNMQGSSWDKLTSRHQAAADLPPLANKDTLVASSSALGHYMIPRIEPSTLRRQQRSSVRHSHSQADRNARIDEEPANEDSDK